MRERSRPVQVRFGAPGWAGEERLFQDPGKA